ncbi:MazG-like family protein [Apilactobacillus xinyiensis]|uniref:MazG-like family protein n=1 Tax=Apilactobacillus xinyiensis TaxID=2841032 RepID=UPI0020350A2A|nr:MazG-like family protein [Apilactobacillus xinyiensis]
MKEINEHQKWLKNFYQSREWYELSPFVRMNFIAEEIGELARAVRAIEIGRDHPGESKKTPEQLDDNLHEELSDLLDQVLVLASKYNISGEELLKYSEHKLHKRFNF